MTEYSVAHIDGMNKIGGNLWPDGRVPWDDPEPPNIDQPNENHWSGKLRTCSYCGSMHPADVAAAIKAGATGSWADMKYGWPHKAYFNGVPNPHAGMLEIRGHATHIVEGWVDMGNGTSHAPAKPADQTVMWKFYSVHLQDASPEDKQTIEFHLGLHFEFTDGRVSWQKIGAQL